VDSQAQDGGDGFGQASGVEIEGVINGTAAAGAGLAEGDEITSVGGHEVTSDTGLQTVMAGYHPGDRVTISWTDGYGQTHTATVTLTAGPAA
jgi:S1-C subfamily serine protease